MPVNASNSDLDWQAPDFNLISVDEQYYSLSQLTGENGTLIAFICNHCPYVVRIIERFVYESIEHIKHKWCIGVQWHPEFLITDEDNLLIEDFIKTARNQ